MNRQRLILLGAVIAGVIVSLLIFNFVRPFILRPADLSSQYKLVEVAKGFTRPIYMTSANDNTGRLFVVEQDGLIRILANGAIEAQPFLDVSALVSREGSERGLLGLAFHPQFRENGLFFINYTDKSGNTNVARYSLLSGSSNQADPNSAKIIIQVDQPYPNHNAGQLAFGPDGYLYFGLGDGGSSGDPQGNGQNGRALLGKMLRLDIDNGDPYGIPADNPFAGNPNFAPEIWAWGLRNPWRYSFDSLTGDLYIADVGQNAWEEINFQPANSTGGENYGWNVMEGTHRYSDAPPPPNLVAPVAEYNHTDGCSVTGGYVYRGSAIPTLVGAYIFGDYCSGTTWLTRRNSAGAWETQRLMNTGRVISSFGTDEEGELYLVDYGGSLLRFEDQS